MQLPNAHYVVQALMMTEGARQQLINTDASQSLSNNSFLPGGTPLKLCPASSSTDLFQITSAEVTKQPIYLYVYGQ